jgi:hypothetical protein
MPTLDIDTSDRITATIPEFRRLSGISRSRIYELLDAGELESVHLGTRRLIVIDSYRRLLVRLQMALTAKRPHPAEVSPAAAGEPRRVHERPSPRRGCSSASRDA